MSPPNGVTAPILEPGGKVEGPASYFPSIETTYGRPIQEWLDLVTPQWTAGSSHMEIVTMLKDAHGMGHGHANAIVAYVKAALTSARLFGSQLGSAQRSTAGVTLGADESVADAVIGLESWAMRPATE